MKIVITAFALIVASLSLASTAKAEDCYWDRAQQARVCHPSPQEREAWRRGREHGERRHEIYWWYHDRPHWWHGDRW